MNTSAMTQPDIVVTGVGVVSALGVGRDAFWQNCLAARSGVRSIDGLLEGDFQSPIAGLVTDFDPRRNLKPAVYRRMSRLSRMAASACVEAVDDSGLDLGGVDTSRVAVVAGTAHGSSASIEAFFGSVLSEGPRGAQPMYFPETVPNAPAGNIAMILGITGPNTTFGQNDISAENALVYARRLLADGRVDAAVVCGLDELNPMFFGCFSDLKALNPGQKNADGTLCPRMGAGLVLGEGAGAVILERRDHALGRLARVYAAFDGGVVLSGGAPVGRYDGCKESLQKAVNQALEMACRHPGGIDQVCVSANFSGALETVEARALQAVGSKDTAWRRVTPLRYLSGSFGGAGILNAIALACSLDSRKRLPVIDLTVLTREKSPIWQSNGEGPPEAGLVTACTYGGGCAALIFSRTGDNAS